MMHLQREGSEIAQASFPLAVLEPPTCGMRTNLPYDFPFIRRIFWLHYGVTGTGTVEVFRRAFVSDAISAVDIERVLESLPRKEVEPEGDE